MKKIWMFLLWVPLFAAMQIQTATPKTVHRLYLGSFLAIGYLPANSRYVIDAPVEGVVEKLDVKIYQKVKKGETLLALKSPTILELEAEFIQTLIERDFFANELKRLKPLYEQAVIAKKVYLKALNEYKKYQTKAKFYADLLQSWGLEAWQVKRIISTKKPLPTIVIKAPISGEVADLAVHPKSYLQRGDHILTIVDVTKTHYEVLLPLDIASQLSKGMDLYVNGVKATVESIAPTVDPNTQSIAVHLLPQTDVKLLPNQKVNVKLYLQKDAFLVPSSAVVDKDGSYGIYVKRGEKFEFVAAKVLARSERGVYIEAPIDPKSQIAVSNVVILKQRDE